VLQHDKDRPHTSRVTVEAIRTWDLSILAHRPYSPDLAPCDFNLFPKIKEDLRGHQYASNEAVKRTVKSWLRKQSGEFFRDGFMKLVYCWWQSVQLGGDYVEK
jgi:histone-lysine N-methyltransferase SETMAR